MRHSIMKRGKEAGVSDFLDYTARWGERLDRPDRVHFNENVIPRAKTLQKRCEELEGAVTEAAARFREYERNHSEKGTTEGDVKAGSNRRMAERMERALQPPRDEGKRESGDG